MGKSKSRVKALDNSTCHLLKRVAQVAGTCYVDKVGDTGLTQRQFTVLAAISEFDGISQTDLAILTFIDRSTLADLVGRMIAQGYLRRKKHRSDARRNVLKLTSVGKNAYADAKPLMINVDRKLNTLVPKEHRKSFKLALRALSKIQSEAS